MKARTTRPPPDTDRRRALGMPKSTRKIQAVRWGFLLSTGILGIWLLWSGQEPWAGQLEGTWQTLGRAGSQKATRWAWRLFRLSGPFNIPSAPGCAPQHHVKFWASCPNLIVLLHAFVFCIYLYFEKLPFSQSGLHFSLDLIFTCSPYLWSWLKTLCKKLAFLWLPWIDFLIWR